MATMEATESLAAKSAGMREQWLAEGAVLMTGILSGAMVLIAFSIVSFWGSLESDEYRLWFTTHAFRIARVMVPLGGFSTLLAGLAWLAARRAPAISRRWLTAALLSLVGLALSYTIFVAPIHAALGSSRALSDPEIRALLASWEAWHWVRVVLGLIAFSAGIRACVTLRTNRPAAIDC